MIEVRVFWALFLALLLGFTFHRSWGLEHGEPAGFLSLGSDDKGKETVVWISPLMFPIIMITVLVMFILKGAGDGLFRFLGFTLDIVVALSLYYILLIVILPFLRRYISARACATLWLIPIFLLYQPSGAINSSYTPLFVIYIPHEFFQWFPYIWLGGFLAIFLTKIAEHFRFRHKIMSSAWDIEEEDILDVWKEELRRLDYKKPVRLVFSKNATAPLSMGMTKKSRVTVLPERSFSPEDLHLIFRHELRHLQRSDVDTKIFLAFCEALCWFNPLVWIAIRKASDDLELSCDEIVLTEEDDDSRRRYAELLLKSASDAQGFTTNLSAAASSMRYRLKNVITSRKRWPGTILLSTVMFLFTMAYGAVAVSSNRGTIGEELLALDSSFNYTRIESVSYRNNNNYYGGILSYWDVEKLYKYVASLEIEELNTANELTSEAEPNMSLYVKINGESALIGIEDKKVEIWKFASRQKKYYNLSSDIDWDYIYSCSVYN